MRPSHLTLCRYVQGDLPVASSEPTPPGIVTYLPRRDGPAMLHPSALLANKGPLGRYKAVVVVYASDVAFYLAGGDIGAWDPP